MPANSTTYASRLTPEIPAGIATIGICGPGAIEAASHFSQLTAKQLQPGRIRYGTWQLSGHASPVGEQVVICRTAEQTIEVHCHGGPAVCRAILQDLTAWGCQPLPQSDWPSGLDCPLARAAEKDLLACTTDRAAAVLLDQMNGQLRAASERILQRLADEPAAAVVQLRQLLAWSELGLHLAQPWQIVLAGPPNVGKSSLLNSMMGQTHAIVHHEPGTTRDWIECRSALGGWPVSLTDTAGIRSAEDAIEQQGVQRSLERLQAADLVVFVVDATEGWTAVHSQLQQAVTGRQLIAWNKADLECALPLPEHFATAAIATSSRGQPGWQTLLTAIIDTLVPDVPPAGLAVPFRPEQVAALDQACQFAVAGQLPSAIDRLRQMLALD